MPELFSLNSWQGSLQDWLSCLGSWSTWRPGLTCTSIAARLDKSRDESSPGVRKLEKAVAASWIALGT